MTSIRPFIDADYAPYVELHNRVHPDERMSERELRYADETWDKDRLYKRRVLAEDETGALVGLGLTAHMEEQFHPDKYYLNVMVDPVARRRGHGGAICDNLLADLRQRGAVTARTWVKESDAASNQFVTTRGFVENRREWPSRLDVAAFDPAPFAGAGERVAGHGITITTLAAETPHNDTLLPELYELDSICSRDVPDIDPFTAMPFADFLKSYVNGPYVIPDAFFLAKHGDRYVGLARLFSSDEEPEILNQDLTGVIPDYRGKGVAMALKLATVAYAKQAGKREIRTWNDTVNRAMLRINEAMGFARQPAEVVYLKELDPDQGVVNA